ncbi:maleylpyruvate isomerase N-terminal domain-containing protein [Umezawaea endophytica]|uniref:Maleylpyruvate isomerase N-terminal domain-containing protein n=1 Tax=Umezawaea endophytica TaxID=1654476 RepID=A0A9X3AI39_9PSEU|nr:maleylpyruvate isomerase N-terminal domain-containing protein [Umezawaea endophytica]MCS7482567.1 maleylpyruvate isomerase N-terminal domain-containing protein [Umezawaea endophytica]
MDTTDLRAAAAECAAFLDTTTAADWTTPIPGMEWTAAKAVAHISDCLLWYAADFVAGTAELTTMDLAVRPSSSPSELVRTLRMAAEVLARTLGGSAPGDRGWHDFGSPDASGVVAMACDELLVHTGDAAAGLGVAFTPSDALVERTVRRLFPEAPEGHEPWPTLLWANGRVPLGGTPRREKWTWHCAPLDG